MTGLLNAASATELADLHVWLGDHPADTDEIKRWAAQSWLGEVIDNAEDYPAFIVVPTDHVEVIDAVIEDWIEILTSHDESFLTTLQVTE